MRAADMLYYVRVNIHMVSSCVSMSGFCTFVVPGLLDC